MNVRKLLISLLAFAVIGGTSVGISLFAPAPIPASTAVELPRTTRLTCLTSGDALVYAPGNATGLTPTTGDELFSGNGRFDDIAGPFVVQADSLAMAGSYSAEPARSYEQCLPAATAGTLLVTEPGSMELVIANSDANEAVVDLTLLGPDGEIPAVGARGIAVAPGVSRRIALSVLAPEGPVGVSFTASEGRVAVAAVNVESRPPRVVVATQPAETQLIGGVPAEATDVSLVLTNPGVERAEVTVHALGATASYELAATADLSVEAMSSVSVPIADSLGGEAAAIRIESGTELSAAVVVNGAAGDAVTLVAQEPARELGAATLGGAVQITNPGSDAVTVTTTASEQLTVGAGATVVFEVDEAEVHEITVSAGGPVVASAAVVDPAGTVIIPFTGLADEPRSSGAAQLNPHLR